jgi:hypothetical protein
MPRMIGTKEKIEIWRLLALAELSLALSFIVYRSSLSSSSSFKSGIYLNGVIGISWGQLHLVGTRASTSALTVGLHRVS